MRLCICTRNFRKMQEAICLYDLTVHKKGKFKADIRINQMRLRPVWKGLEFVRSFIDL